MRGYLLLLKQRKGMLLISYLIILSVVYYIWNKERFHFEGCTDMAIQFFYFLSNPSKNFLFSNSIVVFIILIFSRINVETYKTEILTILRIGSLNFITNKILFHFLSVFFYLIILYFLVLLFIHLVCCKMTVSSLLYTRELIVFNNTITINNIIYLIIYMLLSSFGYSVFSLFTLFLFSYIKKTKTFLFLGLLLNNLMFYMPFSIAAISIRSFNNTILYSLCKSISVTNITNPFMYDIAEYADFPFSYTPVIDYFAGLLFYVLIIVFLVKRKLKRYK